jgi:pimeloyl-ACP methyl ester carboxylesterase
MPLSTSRATCRAIGYLLTAACVLLTPLQSSHAAAQITVHCIGSGDRMYLIGGGPAFTTWHLDPIQQRLKDGYRVCRWDMRGVGDNAGLPIVTDTPVLSQWLDDMAQVLPDEPVILWGHSWGALQALLFTRQHPERVAGLLLSNPVDPALRSLEHIESKRHIHAHPQARLDLDDIGTAAEKRHSFRSKISSYFLDSDTGWAYSAQFSAADTNNVLNVRIWDEYRANPLGDADMQVLGDKVIGVLQCQQDVLMPETAQEYRRLLPTQPQRMLEGCAHFPWVETPQAYYDALLDSLDATAPGYTDRNTRRMDTR